MVQIRMLGRFQPSATDHPGEENSGGGGGGGGGKIVKEDDYIAFEQVYSSGEHCAITAQQKGSTSKYN